VWRGSNRPAAADRTGHAAQAGHIVARASLTLRRASPGREVTPAVTLPGATLTRLPGPQRRPAIIVLGGSEGNDWAARDLAPRLASRGYAVLGLPYYAPGNGGPPRADLASLPSAFIDIPVDRLDQARAWLRQILNVEHIRAIAPWPNDGYRVTVAGGLEVEMSRRQARRFQARTRL